MPQPYDGWLDRELAQAPLELQRPWTISRKWEKVGGGRIMFGEVTLTAAPSQAFSFTEEITWPTDYPYFKRCVLDGILDAVFIDLAGAPSHVSFVLNEIKWHEATSVPHAYYRAAREAVEEVFAEDERASFASLLERTKRE